MNLVAALSATLGLAVAGLDPIGALVIIPAVLSGTRRRVIALFPIFTVAATLVVGLLLGESIGFVLDWLRNAFSMSDTTRGVLQLVVAVLLAVWVVKKLRTSEEPEAPKVRRSLLSTPLGLTLAGTGWGAASLTDPSFYALAAIASSEPLWLAGVMYLLWGTLSQAPLMVLMIALIAGRNSHQVQRAMDWAEKSMKPAQTVMTVLLGVLAVLLAANALTYFVGGAYWPI